MKNASHWPRHFYLIARGFPPCNQQNSLPATMGNKAFNLLKMASIGLRVPPALVIGTHYAEHAQDCLLPLSTIGVPALDAATGLQFGDPKRPLVVSVRSGAPISMPGMMETLLNVGLSESTLPGLLRQTGNPRLVWDAYRRLIATYAEVVEGVDGSVFDAAITQMCQGRDERLLDFNELRSLSRVFLALFEQHVGRAFPQDVKQQLNGAVQAVFASWNSDKAKTYRRLNQIDSHIGTAVTIQQMVFGNAGSHSGAGVGFTRNPMDGRPALWVDFLSNAQGEDVVAGQRNARGHESLAHSQPQVWHELQDAAAQLEKHFQDMQDFEFTVQNGTLYMLQTRAGKRMPMAAARIALDLLEEGIIDAQTATARTKGIGIDELSRQHIVADSASPETEVHALAEAATACQGIAVGVVALDEAAARRYNEQGQAVVLVRQDAQTSDIAVLDVAQGLLTQRGARTSHAAVVARQLGKVCLVGCDALHIDMRQRVIEIQGHRLIEGDWITLDGNEGRIYTGQVHSEAVPDQTLIARLDTLRQRGGTQVVTPRAEANATTIEDNS